MDAREFLSLYALKQSGDRGYRGYCVALLAKFLKVSERTIAQWGSAPDFPLMPPEFRQMLAVEHAKKILERDLRDRGLTDDLLFES